MQTLASCTSVRPVRSGDLVFVVEDFGGASDSTGSDTSGMGEAITIATDRDGVGVTHVGILAVMHDTVYVIDATPARGVCRRPLQTLMDDSQSAGGRVRFVVMRIGGEFDAEASLRRAETLVGRDYDSLFLPGNDAFYCSELVQECCRDSAGNPLFSSSPMNFKALDGTYPAYWVGLFRRNGIPIPQGIPGTNPHDMMQSPRLHKVCEQGRRE